MEPEDPERVSPTSEAAPASEVFVVRAALGLLLLAAAIWLFQAGQTSLLRTQRLTPDSMVYIDAARNLCEGRGLTQSVLIGYGPRDLAAQPLMQPLVLWAPGYPLAVAALHRLGLEYVPAALLAALLGCAALLAATLAWTWRCHGPWPAMVAAAALMAYEPFRMISQYALSESLALAFLMLVFLLLRPQASAPRLALAGLCAGLAFATRHALAPAVLLGLIVLAEPLPWLVRLRRLGVFVAGFTLVVAPMLLRNLHVSGTLLGPQRPPSTVGFSENFQQALGTLTQQYLSTDFLSAANQSWLWFTLLLLVFFVSIARDRLFHGRDALRSPEQLLPLLWGLGYFFFIILYRSRYDLDALGPRLLAPALLPLVPPGVALLMQWINPNRLVSAFLILLLLGIAGLEARDDARFSMPRNLQKEFQRSERLQWAAKECTERDLIIGDSTMDIPLHCGLRQTLCFLPVEDPAQQLDYRGLCAFVAAHQGDVERFYILWRIAMQDLRDPRWKTLFGGMVADLATGRLEPYPGVRLQKRLDDAFVFDVDPDALRPPR